MAEATPDVRDPAYKLTNEAPISYTLDEMLFKPMFLDLRKSGEESGLGLSILP